MAFQLVGHPLLQHYASKHRDRIEIISLESIARNGFPNISNVVISCMAPDRGTEIFGDYVNFDGMVSGPYPAHLPQQFEHALMDASRAIYVILPQRHPVSFKWQHKSFHYIELPEFYGTYWDFYSEFQPLYEYDPWNLDALTTHYMCLLKRITKARFVLFHELVNFNLLDKGHVSFMFEQVGDSGRYTGIGQYREFAKSFVFKNYGWSSDLQERVEKILPYQNHSKLAITDNFCSSGGWITDSDLFASSFVNVIVETYLETPGNAVFTEKTFKTIYHRRPFFLLGSPNSLVELRNLGFRTFDRWFDESYDWGPNPLARALKISSQIRKLCELSLPEIRTMLLEMKPIIEHNYHRLAELRQQLGKRVDQIDRYIIERVEKLAKSA
jgi:hypothetical protein